VLKLQQKFHHLKFSFFDRVRRKRNYLFKIKIFLPFFLVIRFVESDTNGKQSENPTSPKRTDRCLLILFEEKIGMLQLEDTLRVQRKEEYLK